MINIPRVINFHFLHASCPLILLTIRFDKCASCEKSGSGLAFRCGMCNFDLCVKCAFLPTVKYKGADKIRHFAHKHQLALRENKESDSEVRCKACGENCLDPCFGCVKRSCNFFLHKSCAEFPQQIHHPFHPLHPLTLSPLPSDPVYDKWECLACRGKVDRFMMFYQCANCPFILHADCAKPEHTRLFKYGNHPHQLTFLDKTRAPIRCRLCNVGAQSCFLRCVACEFSMHLYCHPSALEEIKHKGHLHPLTLTKSPFEFELISPQYKDRSDDDEFYCDVCEEKRYGFESVYYCEKCKFIAEIRCVLDELLPSTFPKDESDVKGEENSAMEATIEKLRDEIIKLKAKKEPLEQEIEKLQKKLSRIESRLEKVEKDHALYRYQLDCNNNKYPTEASTSEGRSPSHMCRVS